MVGRSSPPQQKQRKACKKNPQIMQKLRERLSTFESLIRVLKGMFTLEKDNDGWIITNHAE